MFIDFLKDTFKNNADKDCIVWNQTAYTYKDLLDEITSAQVFIKENQLTSGMVVAVESDFSPMSIALILALIENANIIVPLTASVSSKKEEFLESSYAQVLISFRSFQDYKILALHPKGQHELLEKLKKQRGPGILFFSSGSTGKSKAILHGVAPLLEKFKVKRNTKRMISFLLFDHMGGFNTMLHILSNAGCVVVVPDRKPETVAKAIADFKVEVLPTSPTFLNLLLLSEAYKRYSLSSLQLVTYGTEPMPESTLKKFREVFPEIELQQTYGMSELGVVRSKSKSSDSLWVKIGGNEFQTRVVDGLLEIKAQSAMLGYLNAPDPFTADGWIKTGDFVDVDGDYIRFRGRKSDVINIGGEKVFPAEVESVLLELHNVEGVVVTGEPHPIMGQIVKATVHLCDNETLDSFKKRMFEFCRDRLPRNKIPQKVILSRDPLYSERSKQIRIV